VLWAHRISNHSAIKVTPFELVYEQEVILPVEVNLDDIRVFGNTLELETVDNEIIVLSTKMVDETPWISPLGQIWSKNAF
jgi:hypothetical protein